MNDRLPTRGAIRDRTLILRVLVPGLETRLRDKMKEAKTNANKDSILDLEGVTCEPTTARNNTLWSFHCDGATYPAKLVNLPCPVEVHKTHDHAAYFKTVDIAQMLIVYEDEMALEEADEKPVDGYSYYHSGLTPPMKNVVERRFAAREHKAIPPPRAAIQDVEGEILKLMDQIAPDNKSTKRNKVPTPTTANKVLEQVEEEIVDYEPWMEESGEGVEFYSKDPLCSSHPQVWLSAETIRKLKEEEESKRKKKEKKSAPKVSVAAPKIAVLKKTEAVDDVTAAAILVNEGGDPDDFLLDDDNFLELDLDEMMDEMDFK